VVLRPAVCNRRFFIFIYKCDWRLKVGGHENLGIAGPFGSARAACKVVLAIAYIIFTGLLILAGGGQELFIFYKYSVGWVVVGLCTTRLSFSDLVWTDSSECEVSIMSRGLGGDLLNEALGLKNCSGGRYPALESFVI